MFAENTFGLVMITFAIGSAIVLSGMFLGVVVVICMHYCDKRERVEKTTDINYAYNIIN